MSTIAIGEPAADFDVNQSPQKVKIYYPQHPFFVATLTGSRTTVGRDCLTQRAQRSDQADEQRVGAAIRGTGRLSGFNADRASHQRSRSTAQTQKA